MLVEVVKSCGSVREPKGEFARTLHRLLGVRNQRGVQYTHVVHQYRSGTLNSNTVNSKFHLIRSFFQIFARFLSFHV